MTHTGEETDKMWRFDTSTRSWERPANGAVAGPGEKSNHVMTSVGLDLWVHGGDELFLLKGGRTWEWSDIQDVGLSAFTPIYDNDVIQVFTCSNDTFSKHMSFFITFSTFGYFQVSANVSWPKAKVTVWNIPLCSQSFLPCSLTIKGVGGTIHRLEQGFGRIICDASAGCSVVSLQDVSVACVGNFVGPEGLLQISGAGSSLRMTKSSIAGCASIADGGSIRAFNGVNVTLREVTITRSSSRGNGGAVALVGVNASVYESFFVDCAAAGSGGAVWVSSWAASYPLASLPAFVHMSNSTLQNNTAAHLGGALTIVASSGGTVQNLIFTDNFADSGGALAISLSSHTIVTSSHFSNNSATDSGGAVVISSKSQAVVERSSLTGNVAKSGGALAVTEQSSLSVTSSHFSKNSATDSGGAVVIASKSDGTVETSFFTGNVAESGGALAVTEKSSAHVQSSSFDENKALGVGGGAMSTSASALELFANSIVGNTAPKGGGGALLWSGNMVPIVRMSCELGWLAGPVNALGRAY